MGDGQSSLTYTNPLSSPWIPRSGSGSIRWCSGVVIGQLNLLRNHGCDRCLLSTWCSSDLNILHLQPLTINVNFSLVLFYLYVSHSFLSCFLEHCVSCKRVDLCLGLFVKQSETSFSPYLVPQGPHGWASVWVYVHQS